MCCRNCTGLHDPVCRARSETRSAVRCLKSPQAGGAKEREPRRTFIQSPGSLAQTSCVSVIPSERCGFSPPFAPAADRKHVRLYLFSKSRNNPPISMQRSSAHPPLLLGFVPGWVCSACWRGTIERIFFSAIAGLYWLNSSKKSNTWYTW